mmetsp:Transcript_6338/g.17778  ORF Transcript_6338/g.17778 Transcript_6338/m.17778 type:complete len:265 (-) Transcript_6338:139-933(-)
MAQRPLAKLDLASGDTALSPMYVSVNASQSSRLLTVPSSLPLMETTSFPLLAANPNAVFFVQLPPFSPALRRPWNSVSASISFFMRGLMESASAFTILSEPTVRAIFSMKHFSNGALRMALKNALLPRSVSSGNASKLRWVGYEVSLARVALAWAGLMWVGLAHTGQGESLVLPIKGGLHGALVHVEADGVDLHLDRPDLLDAAPHAGELGVAADAGEVAVAHRGLEVEARGGLDGGLQRRHERERHGERQGELDRHDCGGGGR